MKSSCHIRCDGKLCRNNAVSTCDNNRYLFAIVFKIVPTKQMNATKYFNFV